MQFVCDAPPKTWFRIETEGEAALESRAMDHAVEKDFQMPKYATLPGYQNDLGMVARRYCGLWGRGT